MNTVRSSQNLDITNSISHCIIGTIQPKVLDSTIFKNGLDSTDGMIERWLFATSKYEETGKAYNSDKPYDITIIKNIFDKLYAVKSPRKYYFSKDAQTTFNQFNFTIVQRKKSDKLSDLMKNYLQKQTDYVARFSLILNCIQNPDRLEIPEYIVDSAIILSKYFVNSFESIAIQRFNTIPLCDYALNYIKTKGKKAISPTQLYKSNTSRYKSTPNAKIVLEILANRGFGRFVEVTSKGGKFISYCS